MNEVFTALEPGWTNIYHDKETDEVYVETCPGVITYNTKSEDALRIYTHNYMGYASFGADGSFALAAKRPHYVRTVWVGPDRDFTRKQYDELLEPKMNGNMWIL